MNNANASKKKLLNNSCAKQANEQTKYDIVKKIIDKIANTTIDNNNEKEIIKKIIEPITTQLDINKSTIESSKKNHHDLGSLRVLKQFELKQKSKNNLFLMMHDVLKEGLTHSSMGWSLARQFAFQLFDKNPLLAQVLKKISG